jgi:hypothetical protein
MPFTGADGGLVGQILMSAYAQARLEARKPIIFEVKSGNSRGLAMCRLAL